MALVQLLRRSVGVKQLALSGNNAQELVKCFCQTRTVEVSVVDDGKRLKLLSRGREEESLFHSLWLRHSCQCSECTYNVQRMVHWSELPNDLRITSASVEGCEGDMVCVNWGSESKRHSGSFPLEWLEKNDYSSPMYQEDLSHQKEPVLADSLPELSYEEVMFTDEGLWRWLYHLSYHGLCLIRNVPTKPKNVIKVAERISHIMPTFYGEMFVIKSVEDPINIAYSSVGLPFHMDLVYLESPPGLQLLHCVRNDDCVSGGKHLLLDAYPMVLEMRKDHPKLFDTLTRVPGTFQKIHFDRDDPVYMKYQCPHIELSSESKVIRINWAPNFEGPLSLPEHEIEEYFEAYTHLSKMFEESPNKIYHRFQPGDIISFNNRRVLHGRERFHLNGGVRHLDGVYVNIDDFKSKFLVLSKLLGKKVTAKNAFNHSH